MKTKQRKDHHFSRYGTSIPKVTKSTIYECKCGERYLKTREGQKVCHRCLADSL